MSSRANLLSSGVALWSGVAHGAPAEPVSTCFPLTWATRSCLAGSARFDGAAFVVEEESICDRGFAPIPFAPLCALPSLRGRSGDDTTTLGVLNELADELVRRVPGLARPTLATFEHGFRVTSSSDPLLDLPSTVDPPRCPAETCGTGVAWSVGDVERCALDSLGRSGWKISKNPNIGGAAWMACTAPADDRVWHDEPLWAVLDAAYRDHGQGRGGFSLTVTADPSQPGTSKLVELHPFYSPPPASSRVR